MASLRLSVASTALDLWNPSMGNSPASKGLAPAVCPAKSRAKRSTTKDFPAPGGPVKPTTLKGFSVFAQSAIC